MLREAVKALVACAVTLVICALIYPAAVWALGQLIFPFQAEGSLVYDRDRTVIGSELIAQPFASPGYFQPRPSAVDYKADATGGSNLGTKNPDLHKKVAERAAALSATDANPVPVDLVTASGGGVDPHISPEAALYQAPRVAAARRMGVEQVRSLIDRHLETSGAVIGAPPRVNVLKLNRALDEERAMPALATEAETAGDKAERPSEPGAAEGSGSADPLSARPDLGDRLLAMQARVAEVADALSRLEQEIDSVPREEGSRDQTATGVKAITERLSKLIDSTRGIQPLRDQVAALDRRVDAAGESLRQLQAGVRETRATLETLAKAKRVDSQ
jgi:K+-transporting ATPase ATPase C chain